jgi:hypothetical protein
MSDHLAAAEMDFREGRVEPVEPPGPHGVVLASGAARMFQRMNPRDRANLRSALVRARADEERLMWLRSGLWLVLFSYPDAETVLVCAVFDARELERELVG